MYPSDTPKLSALYQFRRNVLYFSRLRRGNSLGCEPRARESMSFRDSVSFRRVGADEVLEPPKMLAMTSSPSAGRRGVSFACL